MSSREYESRDTNQSRNEESSNSFLLGALIGGVVGAAAALFLAPKTGKELRVTLSNQAGSIMDKSGQLRENVMSKGNEFMSKTSSLSQGIVQQSSGLLNKVKGKSANSEETVEESELIYIPIHNSKEASEAKKKSIKLKPLDSSEIRRKLEEAQKAFDEEESKVKI
ncbi:YtxH domain-containing protein [Bacillus sp. S3]|uniref:YtxH domain-containing protein n=1 Tax=Bacillus sp. S3 TaxID=486398 RepID=UPI0011883885|nr:YtxH domain-containing protein [Bacillus sp. S3]QCJ43762.1 YtxH domain-containing protein [Bacillus sp. S3]